MLAATKEMLPVAELLRERGCECVLAFQYASTEDLELCKAHRFHCAYAGRNDHLTPQHGQMDKNSQGQHPGRYLPSTTPGTSLRRLTGHTLRALGVYSLITDFRLHRRLKREMAELAANVSPAVVVFGSDTHPSSAFLARYVHDMGGRTLLLQWGSPSCPQRLARRNLRKQRASSRVGLNRFLDFFGKVIWPQYVIEIDGQRVFPKPIGFMLISSVYGTLPTQPWVQGGGRAQCYAVAGEAVRELCLEYGLPEDKLVVTGLPSHDLTQRRVAEMTSVEREKVFSHLGLHDVSRLAVYTTQPLIENAILTPEQVAFNAAFLVNQLTSIEQSGMVIKVHPGEPVERYAYLADRNSRVAVVKNFDLNELTAACDLFITQTSTTGFLAMAAGRPIITFDFDRVGVLDFYQQVGGTRHVTEREDFLETAVALLEDPVAKAALAQEQEQTIARYMRLDGKASERIVSLIEEMIAVDGG